MIVDERALVAAVRDLAAENPEFVYEAPDDGECKYVHQEEDGNLVGGCIVGQAALRVGVSIELLAEIDDLPDPQVVDSFGRFHLSEGSLDWLNEVQSRQDAKFAWGEAVSDADRLVGDPFA